MKWITRERPKIDRIACPWLIKRFIDPDADIIFVPADDVVQVAEQMGATPFDIPGVEYSHYEDKCTFDYFIKKHELKNPALDRIARIVRGADTDRHDFAPQAAGLEAIFSGLAYNIKNDLELLKQGMIIYDGLYSWAQHLFRQRHAGDSSMEQLLLQIYHRYLKQRRKEQMPQWAVTLREIIQDQVDTGMNLDLHHLSDELEISPAYLSREFSRYFDDLNFGEYIRKKRIEKAIELMADSSLSLTEIAYLTGFSDQSHFTRIFNKHAGSSPSVYRKKMTKR